VSLFVSRFVLASSTNNPSRCPVNGLLSNRGKPFAAVLIRPSAPVYVAAEGLVKLILPSNPVPLVKFRLRLGFEVG
jgi:hypothetical protein